MSDVHLIVADDEFLAQVRAEAALAGASDVVALHAESSGVPGLDDALGAQSLFSAARTVVVHDAERLGAAGLRALRAGAGRCSDGLRMLVVAVAERPPAALVKALQDVASVDRASRPRRAELVSWVAGRLRDAGVSVDREAPGLLVEAVGTGLRDLAAAAGQLAIRAGRGGTVGASDVRRAYSGTAEQPVWALYDALLASDGRKAYRVLHALFEQGNDPIGVLFSLVGQNRHVMRAKSVLERSPATSDGSLASALAVSPGRAGVLRRQASRVQWDWLTRLHHDCARADFDLKGGDEVRIVGLLPPEIVVERVVDRALPATEAPQR